MSLFVFTLVFWQLFVGSALGAGLRWGEWLGMDPACFWLAVLALQAVLVVDRYWRTCCLWACWMWYRVGFSRWVCTCETHSRRRSNQGCRPSDSGLKIRDLTRNVSALSVETILIKLNTHYKITGVFCLRLFINKVLFLISTDAALMPPLPHTLSTSTGTWAAGWQEEDTETEMGDEESAGRRSCCCASFCCSSRACWRIKSWRIRTLREGSRGGYGQWLCVPAGGQRCPLLEGRVNQTERQRRSDRTEASFYFLLWL